MLSKVHDVSALSATDVDQGLLRAGVAALEFSRDESLENVRCFAAAAHAAEAHGMTEVPDEVVVAIRAGITDA